MRDMESYVVENINQDMSIKVLLIPRINEQVGITAHGERALADRWVRGLRRG